MNYKKIILITIPSLFLALVIGWSAWYHFALAPANAKDTKLVSFTVESGENVNVIAEHLKEKGLIANPFALELYATLHGYRSKLQSGVYQLSPSMEVSTMVKKFADGDVIQKRLTIPEGSSVNQIRELAVKQGINGSDFDAAIKASHTQSFLTAKPTNVDLEGYLFPDSYTLDPTTSASELVNLMLNNFGTKVTSDYEAAFRARGLTLHQGLTLASIIEKEVANATDRPIVAQVFYSRLKVGQGLESDVTVHYAADQLGVGFDTNLNSPYNTYRNKGLPPGPICSPGLSALGAAAHPANTNFSYFLAGKDGKTYFAHTFAEHQANIAKYLR